MKLARMVVQISYSEDLQTSLLTAAVRLRDAVRDRNVSEIEFAAMRLDDVIKGVGSKMELSARNMIDAGDRE